MWRSWTEPAVVGASTATTVVAIVIVVLLSLAWLLSLVFLVFDTISIGAKVVWFLALTLLAPVAIPAYFLWRRSRRQTVAGDAVDRP
jgi:hypothetical protein